MNNIALSFSGGGFRAAAYSLGCISYLNHIQYDGMPLLHNVKYISSTSGGSLTNLVYNYYIHKGRSFSQCYDFLREKLSGDLLLSNAIQLLNERDKWKERPQKSKNIINAFAIGYEDLFNGENFGIFDNRQNNPHVEEVCVNSTEFTNGLPFRFQTQNLNLPKGRIGSASIYFRKKGVDAAKKIKLSDILAASSCFPSGFEPMIFPKDFSNSTVSCKDLITELSFKTNDYTLKPYNHLSILNDAVFGENIQFGLMDGGITDNQAIDAFKKADERRLKAQLPQFDLYISCDVTSYLMDAYTLPIQKKHFFDFISIRTILLTLLVLTLWLPFIIIFFWGDWRPWHYITGTISSLIWIIGLAFLFNRFRGKEKNVKSTWGTVFKKYAFKLARLSLGEVRQMIASRFKSVFILSNDIYLKQIRRLYYDNIFTTNRHRMIQNTIYDLSRVNFKQDQTYDDVLQPSNDLVEIAEKARTMGTTLWFDSEHQKDKVLESIIATGQFTTCYNLIKFISAKGDQKTAADFELLSKLQADWEKFCEQPDFLV